MNPCKGCELSFRHGGKDGAWMCRGEEGFDGYCKGNVVKYIFREKKKNGIEDLKKARAYLDLLINYRTGKKAANES